MANYEKLNKLLDNIQVFVSHNMGAISGATTTYESVLLELLKSVSSLKLGIKNKATEAELNLLMNEFEAKLMTAQLVSSGTSHGDRLSPISSNELEVVFLELDNLRKSFKL